jgi:hypothetical protein
MVAQFISILNVLVPIVTPVIAAIVVSIRERRTRRSIIGRRKLALEDAQAQVAFVNEWWNARRAVDVSGGPGSASSQEAEQLARAWLDRASRLVAENELVLAPSEGPGFLRRLALLYQFRSTAGKVVRVLFWICCGLTVIVIGLTVTQWIGSKDPLVSLATDELAGQVFIFIVAAGVVILPATVISRFLAIFVDRYAAQGAESESHAHSFPREVLLLRPMCGRAAGTVRVLFYVSLLGVLVYITYSVEMGVFRPGGFYLVPYTAAVVGVYATACLGIRAWAVYLDREARRSSRAATPMRSAAEQGVKGAAATPEAHATR